MGTQTKITDKITANGGDYILAVKGNQSGLEEEVEATCGSNCSVSDKTKVDKGHGQIETHRCEVFDKGLIADKEKRWVGLKTIVKITATHETGEKTETSTRLYISSLDT
jgi:hypothetical protein